MIDDEAAEPEPHALLLSAILRARGWSRLDLAARLCVHRNTLRRWERSGVPAVALSRLRELLAYDRPVVQQTVLAQAEALALLALDVADGRLTDADAARIRDAMEAALGALTARGVLAA